MSMSFTQGMFFVALALLGFSFGALLVIYPPLTGGAFGTSNIGVNYGIMFLGYAASTWISQPITAVLYHAEAGSAAYQQSFYGAIVIAAIAVVLTVYMMSPTARRSPPSFTDATKGQPLCRIPPVTSIKESKCLSSTPSALPLSRRRHGPQPHPLCHRGARSRARRHRRAFERPRHGRAPACRFIPIPPR